MKIAMCQMLSEYGRPEENLSRAKEMLRDAARQGALLALAAGQGDLHSHPLGTSLHSEIRLCAMGTETFL